MAPLSTASPSDRFSRSPAVMRDARRWHRLLSAVAIGGCALLLAACFAPSEPDPGPDQESRLPPVADPLPLSDLADFSGVARLNMGSNCTGTLIDTGVADAPAYILTNGHCTGDIGRSAQGVTVGEEWFGTADFFAAEGNDAVLPVEAEVLEYSTMRGRDLAIVRLDSTLGELEQQGVQPVPITENEPEAGTAVVNIGVPVQELDPDDWVLRRGLCSLGEQHTLIESSWLWFQAWSNDCPGIVQGSSGSPLLTTDDTGAPDAIVSMINTTSWGVTAADGGPCFINRPCQVTADGAEMVEETSYGVSVAGVNRCFTDAGEFMLGGECPLETSSVWATRGGGSFRGGVVENAVGQVPEVSLVGAEPGSARTALVPLGDGSACLSPDTFAAATPVAFPAAGEPWEDGSIVPVTLPEKEGRYVFCAVVGDDYAGAASVLFDVDRTPPIFEADATVEHLGGGAVMVRPHVNPPEISTVRFTWGAPDDVDCDATDTFDDLFIAPLTILGDDLPATYCVYGMDAAGNPTPVTEIDIPSQR